MCHLDEVGFGQPVRHKFVPRGIVDTGHELVDGKRIAQLVNRAVNKHGETDDNLFENVVCLVAPGLVLLCLGLFPGCVGFLGRNCRTASRCGSLTCHPFASNLYLSPAALTRRCNTHLGVNVLEKGEHFVAHVIQVVKELARASARKLIGVGPVDLLHEAARVEINRLAAVNAYHGAESQELFGLLGLLPAGILASAAYFGQVLVNHGEGAVGCEVKGITLALGLSLEWRLAAEYGLQIARRLRSIGT
ncbi:membrane protein [gut metagenome]|uniref:Membrane protein n=1 Tax=gut metagenome TaxID=749906 RepID=J9G6J9_9ZZZZ